MIWLVIWVVLMLFWLFFGGMISYDGAVFNGRRFGGYTLIPWACVAILGAALFGAITIGPIK